MKNSLYFLLLLPFAGFAQNYHWVNNGMQAQIPATTQLVVSGTVANESGGIIQNEGTIYVAENWEQSDATAQYTGAGSVVMNGSQTQYLWGSFSIANLIIDNNDSLVLNNGILGITNQIHLSNSSYLVLDSADVQLAAGATVLGYDNQHYIVSNGIGSLQQTVSNGGSVFFPIGNSSYAPITLHSSGATDVYGVRVVPAAFLSAPSSDPAATGTQTTQAVAHTWHITEATAGGTDMELTTQWNALAELVGFNRDSCAIAYWTGTDWEGVSTTAATDLGNGEYSQQRAAITTIGSFAVKSNLATAIPSVLSPEASCIAFPSPTADIISVQFHSFLPQFAQLSVFDAVGKQLFIQTIWTSNTVELPQVKDFPAGTYFIHLSFFDNSKAVLPFVKL